MDLFDKQVIIKNWPYAEYWHRRCFGLVEYNSIAYVAGYILKKYGDVESTEWLDDREAPFRLLSQGLGREYADNNIGYHLRIGGVPRNQIVVSMPRYYIKRAHNQGIDYVAHNLANVLNASAARVEYFTGYSNIPDIETLYGHDDVAVVKYFKGDKLSRSQHAKNLYAKMRINVSSAV